MRNYYLFIHLLLLIIYIYYLFIHLLLFIFIIYLHIIYYLYLLLVIIIHFSCDFILIIYQKYEILTPYVYQPMSL